MKDNVKQGTVENVVNDQNRGHNLSPREEERFFGSLNDNRGTANSSFHKILQSRLLWIKMEIEE